MNGIAKLILYPVIFVLFGTGAGYAVYGATGERAEKGMEAGAGVGLLCGLYAATRKGKESKI